MTPGDFLAAFTWRDALDFGLLYVAFYGILRLPRGTRSVPVPLAVAFFEPSISSLTQGCSNMSSSTSSSS